MKKFTKIISLICIAILMLSFSVFADIEDGEYIDCNLKTDKASYKVGDTVVVTLYTDAKTGTENLTSLYAYIAFTDSELEYVSCSNDGASLKTKTNGDHNKQVSIEKDYDEPTAVPWAEMATITFTALKAGSFTVDMVDFAVGDANWTGSAGDEASVTVVVKGDEPDPVTNVTPDKNASAEVTFGENKYTGLYTYSLETNVTKFNLVATYNGGSTKNLKYAGSEAIELNNIDLKDGEGTITFKIAIIGVPADVTISDLAIQAIQ